MKTVKYKLLPPFTIWAKTDAVILTGEQDDNLRDMFDHWFESHDEIREQFESVRAYKNGHIEALYMKDNKFFKGEHIPCDGEEYVAMSTYVGG